MEKSGLADTPPLVCVVSGVPHAQHVTRVCLPRACVSRVADVEAHDDVGLGARRLDVWKTLRFIMRKETRRQQRHMKTHGPAVRQSDVPWVTMPYTFASESVNETTDDGFEGLDMADDDFLGLQTAEGFDVVYETDETGNRRAKIVKLNETNKRKQKQKEAPIKPYPAEPIKKRKVDDDEDVGAMLQAARERGILEQDDTGDDGKEDADASAPGWAPYALHPVLKKAMVALGFNTPTDVQAATLPPSLGTDAMPPRDVVGVAQTGSGKTLAYALPILQYILENTAHSQDPARSLEALVLTPTRELALQVCSHIRAVVEAGGRFANVAAICGGMSVQKQERVLLQHGGAHIVVATPGRLWDMIKHDDALALRVRRTRFLVIDEADRMIEAGHFAEMDLLLQMVRRTKGAAADANPDMQTFVYSATMSKALQTNLKRALWRKKQRREAEPSNTLDDLLARVDFRDAEPIVIEMATQRHVADTLYEAKMECVGQDKDAYLYYILLRYPGRTLVFVNAIDGVRRLVPLLTLLGIPAYPLHGQLQQQQRLKNLDRFRRAPHAALLATDVAARGIDIQGVDHVVHFQVPRSADTYVHRAGRTARAGREGVSIALIEPSELRLWRAIWQALERQDTVPTMPVEYTFLTPIRERLALARDIDALSHAQTKESHDDHWLRSLAREADVEYESDEEPDPDANVSHHRRHSSTKARVAQLKAQLAHMLSRPLQARGMSQKYLTSTTRPGYVHALLEGRHAPHMLGMTRSKIHDDMSAKKQRT